MRADREAHTAGQCRCTALGFLLDRAPAGADVGVRREIHPAATALVLRDVDELVSDHVATERAVQIEVIGDRDVGAVREGRRVEALRRIARRATAVQSDAMWRLRISMSATSVAR